MPWALSFHWGSTLYAHIDLLYFWSCPPQVIVRDAGHILPHDQPARGYDMIQRFVEGKAFA